MILYKMCIFMDCELNSNGLGMSLAAGVYVGSECCGNFKIIRITAFSVEEHTLSTAFIPKLNL